MKVGIKSFLSVQEPSSYVIPGGSYNRVKIYMPINGGLRYSSTAKMPTITPNGHNYIIVPNS
jgi:hypothetical protein